MSHGAKACSKPATGTQSRYESRVRVRGATHGPHIRVVASPASVTHVVTPRDSFDKGVVKLGGDPRRSLLFFFARVCITRLRLAWRRLFLLPRTSGATGLRRVLIGVREPR